MADDKMRFGLRKNIHIENWMSFRENCELYFKFSRANWARFLTFGVAVPVLGYIAICAEMVRWQCSRPTTAEHCLAQRVAGLDRFVRLTNPCGCVCCSSFCFKRGGLRFGQRVARALCKCFINARAMRNNAILGVAAVRSCRHMLLALHRLQEDENAHSQGQGPERLGMERRFMGRSKYSSHGPGEH
jgi:hypothetical protein